MTDHPPWEKLLEDCCTATAYMALATQGEKSPWVNPVYFAHDPRFTFYFISQLHCLHMDNIHAHKSVACAIYPTNQSTFGDVYGLYIQGTAEILHDEDEKKIADDVYYGRKYPGSTAAARAKDGYRLNPDWHFVKITPLGMWYFDTRYFGEERVEVPLSLWVR